MLISLIVVFVIFFFVILFYIYIYINIYIETNVVKCSAVWTHRNNMACYHP